MKAGVVAILITLSFSCFGFSLLALIIGVEGHGHGGVLNSPQATAKDVLVGLALILVPAATGVASAWAAKRLLAGKPSAKEPPESPKKPSG